MLSVECPNCEATFQLAPDRAGKSLRCPECREVFTVPATNAPAAPAAPPDAPRSVAVGEVLHVVEGEAAEAPRPERPFAPAPEALAYDRVEDNGFGPLIVEGEAVTPPPRAPKPPRRKADVPVARRATPPTPSVAPTLPDTSGPREVAWSESVDAPPPAPPKLLSTEFSVPAMAKVDAVADDEEAWLAERAKRKKTRWPVYLIVGALGALGLVIAVVSFQGVRYFAKTEERMAQEADDAYTKGNMAAAQKRFADLLQQFPSSPSRERYEFFERWCGVRANVDSLEATLNPDAARAPFDSFLQEKGNSPFAQPRSGVGADVVDTGRKLGGLFAGFGEDRLKEFQKDRPGQKTQLLDAAKKSVDDGETVLPPLDKFRDRESAGFTELRARFAAVVAGVDQERSRLDALAPFRQLAANPTDTAIEQFRTVLETSGLTNDPEAQGLLSAAMKKLRELIGSVADARPAQPVPAEPFAASAVTAPVLDYPPPSPPPGTPTDVAFAAARGVLYALDAQTGRRLWACHVGENPDNRLADPLPVRVPQLLGGSDAVLVLSDGPSGPGLTARLIQTGTVVWHQPLEASPVGRAVVVGQRAYVPLADPAGTVVEVQLGTGARLSHASIRQPIGGAAVALPAGQPGSGLLVVPADARRLFLFAVGREGPDGRRLPPRCVRILATDHARDTLRGEPLLTPAGPDSPPRLILAQVDGENMKLRAVPLPDAEAAVSAPDAGAGELPAGAAEAPVTGWAWFPPMGDGERVVAATDAGTVAVFGLTPGSGGEPPLYPWPAPAGPPRPAANAAAVSRSLVVAIDEDSAWVVAEGKLQRYRTSVDGANARRLVPDGTPLPVGEPLTRAVVLPALNVAVLTTRPADGTAAHATAFDPRTGLVRWKVQLGAVAAGPAVVAAGSPTILVDEAGGAHAVADDGAVTPILLPLESPGGPARFAASEDGSLVWVLAPESGGQRVRARLLRKGAPAFDQSLPLPASLAGSPVAVGETAVVGLTDGRLFRVRPGDKAGASGPPWRGEGAPADAPARLTPLGPDTFLAVDGDRQLSRWRWPADGEAARTGPPWESAAAFVTSAAVVKAADGAVRYAVADAAGAVRLYDPEQPPEPVRLWEDREAGADPLGGAAGAAAGRVIVSRKARELAGYDPGAEMRAWRARATPDGGPEMVGWTASANEVLTTDQLGRVTAYDPATGAVRADAVPPGVFAQAPARRRGGEVLLPLADGRLARPRLAGP